MEKIKNVFSPGHNVDDELMYGDGNVPSATGQPGTSSSLDPNPVRSAEDTQKGSTLHQGSTIDSGFAGDRESKEKTSDLATEQGKTGSVSSNEQARSGSWAALSGRQHKVTKGPFGEDGWQDPNATASGLAPGEAAEDTTQRASVVPDHREHKVTKGPFGEDEIAAAGGTQSSTVPYQGPKGTAEPLGSTQSQTAPEKEHRGSKAGAILGAIGLGGHSKKHDDKKETDVTGTTQQTGTTVQQPYQGDSPAYQDQPPRQGNKAGAIVGVAGIGDHPRKSSGPTTEPYGTSDRQSGVAEPVATSQRDTSTQEEGHKGSKAGAILGAIGLGGHSKKQKDDTHETQNTRSDQPIGLATTTSEPDRASYTATQPASAKADPYPAATQQPYTATQPTSTRAEPYPATTQQPYTGRSTETDDSHTGRNTALAGAAVATGAIGAHEYSKRDAEKDEEARIAAARAQEKDDERQRKEAEKEQREHEKAVVKEEKEHDKAVAKEEHKAQKEHDKAVKKEEKQAEKEHEAAIKEEKKAEKKHEKVVIAEQKKAEKEHEKEVKAEEKQAEKEHKHQLEEQEKAEKKHHAAIIAEQKKEEKEYEKEVKAEQKQAEKEHNHQLKEEEKEEKKHHAAVVAEQKKEEKEHQKAVEEAETRRSSEDHNMIPNKDRDSESKEKKKGGILGIFKRHKNSKGEEVDDDVDDDNADDRTGLAAGGAAGAAGAGIGAYALGKHHEGKHHEQNKLHKDPPPGHGYTGEQTSVPYADYAVKENDHPGAQTITGGYTAPAPQQDTTKYDNTKSGDTKYDNTKSGDTKYDNSQFVNAPGSTGQSGTGTGTKIEPVSTSGRPQDKPLPPQPASTSAIKSTLDDTPTTSQPSTYSSSDKPFQSQPTAAGVGFIGTAASSHYGHQDQTSDKPSNITQSSTGDGNTYIGTPAPASSQGIGKSTSEQTPLGDPTISGVTALPSRQGGQTVPDESGTGFAHPSHEQHRTTIPDTTGENFDGPVIERPRGVYDDSKHIPGEYPETPADGSNKI